MFYTPTPNVQPQEGETLIEEILFLLGEANEANPIAPALLADRNKARTTSTSIKSEPKTPQQGYVNIESITKGAGDLFTLKKQDLPELDLSLLTPNKKETAPEQSSLAPEQSSLAIEQLKNLNANVTNKTTIDIEKNEAIKSLTLRYNEAVTKQQEIETQRLADIKQVTDYKGRSLKDFLFPVDKAGTIAQINAASDKRSDSNKEVRSSLQELLTNSVFANTGQTTSSTLNQTNDNIKAIANQFNNEANRKANQRNNEADRKAKLEVSNNNAANLLERQQQKTKTDEAIKLKESNKKLIDEAAKIPITGLFSRMLTDLTADPRDYLAVERLFRTQPEASLKEYSNLNDEDKTAFLKLLSSTERGRKIVKILSDSTKARR